MRFLSDNKKLVLSIAINVLFAFALSVVLYFVYPQFIYELDSVSNWSRYSVRTYRKYEGGTAYFEVLMGPKEHLRQPKVPQRIYSYSGKQAFYVETFGSDITGNGVPNLVVRQWQGGAHGDSRYLVLELRDDRGVNEIDVIDGLLGVELQDLNNDGRVEVTGLDKTYSYFCGDSFAASPLPPVVLSFDKTQAKFVADEKLMWKPALTSQQFNQLSLEFKKDARWHKRSRPPSKLFHTVLELIYSGNEEQAWELFDASWPDISEVPKEEYRKALKRDLRNSPFYPFIAGWNEEKSLD
ncbi:MAG: hypothetical protein ACYSW8_06315 [Planctomycetota bacterium]|jgi:hypothetical protein